MFALVRDRIHETAMIGGHPAFGQRVTIGAHTVVYANVTLGDDVVIGPGCIIGEPVNEFYRTVGRIGEPLSIGSGSIIRPGTVIYAGSVIGDLNSRRGQIQGQDMRGNANVINAMVPLMNMFGYVNNLRSMSQGRATFTMQFDHYAEAPANVSAEVQKKFA